MKLKKGLSLILFSIAGIHFFNKYTDYKSKIPVEIPEYNTYDYHWTYGTIHYIKAGSGKPLLLIHDLTAYSSSYEWHRIISNLSKDHTVYALDLLGCGESDKPSLTYTNYVFVKLITDFIKDIVKEACTIISSGKSSTIALMSAKYDYPDQTMIQKIIMINPSSLSEEQTEITEKDQKRDMLFQLPIIGTFLCNRLNKREDIEELFYNEYFADSYQVKGKYIDQYYSSYFSNGKSSKSLFSRIYNHYTNFDYRIALDDIQIPLCIIGGDKEQGIKESLFNFSKYKNLSWCLLEETKHLPQLENPTALTEKIDQYLD